MNPLDLALSGSGGASGPATGTANNGLSLPFSTPFNFDGSGWVVNMGSPGAVSTASGNTGANPTNQTANPTASSAGSGMAAGMGTARINAGMPSFGAGSMPLILGAVGLFLVLSHR